MLDDVNFVILLLIVLGLTIDHCSAKIIPCLIVHNFYQRLNFAVPPEKKTECDMTVK